MLLKYKIATHRFLSSLKNFFRELRGVFPYHGSKFLCPVCNTGLKYFDCISYDYIKQLEDNAFAFPFFMLETSTIAQHGCPCCKATDRDRLYVLYINKMLNGNKVDNKLKIIDFAPQHGLSRFLKKNEKLDYRSADLYMSGVDDKVDITDMRIYKDDSIDMFICSHILEHIEDDIKAIRELYRILKPGGWGIAMVPIMLSLEENYEDSSIITENERWKYYMQNDHVRLYSKKGFISNLEKGGFTVKQYDSSFFGVNEFIRHGIQERSVLYVVGKPSV